MERRGWAAHPEVSEVQHMGRGKAGLTGANRPLRISVCAWVSGKEQGVPNGWVGWGQMDSQKKRLSFQRATRNSRTNKRLDEGDV